MSSTGSKTILICDDEPHIRESIRYTVAKAGFICVQAHDGHECYDKARVSNPDLIILDVGMPGMNGFEVCEKLRAEPAFATTKIIMLTAFGQASDEQRAVAVGADRFITKPFSPRALREVLKEMLEES